MTACPVGYYCLLGSSPATITGSRICRWRGVASFTVVLAACPAGTNNPLTNQPSWTACVGELLLLFALWSTLCRPVLGQGVWPAPTPRRRRHRAHVTLSALRSIDRCMHACMQCGILAECPAGSYCGASTAAANISGAASDRSIVVFANSEQCVPPDISAPLAARPQTYLVCCCCCCSWLVWCGAVW